MSSLGSLLAYASTLSSYPAPCRLNWAYWLGARARAGAITFRGAQAAQLAELHGPGHDCAKQHRCPVV